MSEDEKDRPKANGVKNKSSIKYNNEDLYLL